MFGVAEGGVVAVVFGEGDGAEDGGEEVIEIVRDAAGEQTKGFEAVRLHEFLGCEGHLVGVAEHDDDTAGAAVGAEGGAGGPDDRGGRLAVDGGGEGVGPDEREGLVGGEGAFDGIVAGAMALAVDEMKDVSDRLAAEGFGGETKEGRGGGVGENDFAAGVGDEDGLGEGAQRLGDEGGREAVAVGRGGRGEVGGQGNGEADDAGEVAFAGEAAVGAEEDGHGTAVLGAEADRLDERGLAGGAREQPRFEAAGRLFGGEGGGEGRGRGGEFAFGVAEEFFPRGREPEKFAGEIEFEGGEGAAAAEVLEPGLVGEGVFLELFALGNVEMETDDALEFAGGAYELEADALNPHPVAAPVFHAELDAEGAGADGEFFTDLVGCGGGVFGVDVLVPGVERVGQFGIGVAEDFFPGGRKAHAAGGELEVEETGSAFFGEQSETGGGVVAARGGRGKGGRLDCGEVTGDGAEDFFEAHADFAGRALAGLGGQGGGAVECADQQGLPLGLEELGVGGNDLEGEEGGEGFAEQFGFAGLPEGARGGVGGGDAAGGVEHQDGGGRGIDDGGGGAATGGSLAQINFYGAMRGSVWRGNR